MALVATPNSSPISRATRGQLHRGVGKPWASGPSSISDVRRSRCVGIEERLASGAPGLAESGRTLLAVLPPPRTDGLASDFQPSRRLGLIVALVEQPHRFETALPKGVPAP